MPGLGALNKDGKAEVNDVSCVSPGYCAAGGQYEDRFGNDQGFVAAGRNGRWGTAAGIPGLAALNAGRDAEHVSVSCTPAGFCVAGGQYEDRSGNYQGFAASERNSRWGKAIEVPGLGALNAGGFGFAEASSMSCALAGYCAAGGYYQDKSDRTQGFVITERNGRWRTATQIPGLQGDDAVPGSVSCASAGNCAAGGSYADRHNRGQGFVIIERNGRWAQAIQIPGLQALNTGGSAQVSSVSCDPAGNCAAGGSYTAGSFPISFPTQGFVASRSS